MEVCIDTFRISDIEHPPFQWTLQSPRQEDHRRSGKDQIRILRGTHVRNTVGTQKKVKRNPSACRILNTLYCAFPAYSPSSHNRDLLGGEVVEGVDKAVDFGFEGGDVGGMVGGFGGKYAVDKVGDGRLLLGSGRRNRDQ